ncbi:MAG TPA: hypothetical protein VF762_02875 [Blastocatellia bacterium]|jgi:hypothetical protein
MAGLVAQLLIDGVWTDAGAVPDNTTGTPLVSAAPNFDGRAISDLYSLTFTSVIAGTSATVHVNAQSSRNPYEGTSASVNLDGTTVYSNIIPGVDLVFSSSGTFASSWSATVAVGLAWGLKNAFPPDAGTASDGVRVRVHNTGTGTGSGCKARLLSALKAYKKTGTVVAKLRGFSADADEKLDGSQVAPYALTASAVSGSGASKTMTIEIDGDPFDTLNLGDETTGDNTGLNVVDFYQVTSGPLEGMEFKLSQSAVNGDAVNVLVFSKRFAQIAPDVGGAPGDWGTSDVSLTEEGEADSDITADGLAYFWMRVLVPANGNSQSNPYIIDIALEGSALNAAGWIS